MTWWEWLIVGIVAIIGGFIFCLWWFAEELGSGK